MIDLTVIGYWILIATAAGLLVWAAIRNEPPRAA